MIFIIKLNKIWELEEDSVCTLTTEVEKDVTATFGMEFGLTQDFGGLPGPEFKGGFKNNFSPP